jgi:hypothetical protein
MNQPSEIKRCADCPDKCENRQPHGYCLLVQIGKGSYRIVPFNLQNLENSVELEALV